MIKHLFPTAIRQACKLANEGKLVAFGVPMSKAETGYGYIKVDSTQDLQQGSPVLQFIEKPDTKTAQGFLDEGGYYWNSGMFMLTAEAYLAELTKYRPNMVRCVEQAMQSSQQDGDFLRPDSGALQHCDSESIDYAVMESTNKAWMLALNVNWSDVGSWDAVLTHSQQDDQNNACFGDVFLTKDFAKLCSCRGSPSSNIGSR